MTRPAYLVEGDLEQKFIQNTCPGCKVQKINCNGDDVSLEAIAKRVGSLGRLVHERHSPLVVIFDRERREETSEQIEAKFREILAHEQLQVPVIVGIPDRDTENWILSDYETFASSAKLKADAEEACYEGKNGKSVIKRAIGPERSYVETIDGVAWLKAARPSVMRQNSASFCRFVEALSALPCWWLDQQDLPPRST
jgi:hypothetical protein